MPCAKVTRSYFVGSALVADVGSLGEDCSSVGLVRSPNGGKAPSAHHYQCQFPGQLAVVQAIAIPLGTLGAWPARMKDLWWWLQYHFSW